MGLIMMLVAIATGVGLKYKIREKVSAFNGHIQIFNYDNNLSDVSVLPVSKEQEFFPEFKTIDGISHIQTVATKGGIIRTEDTFEGVIAKGVGPEYNWSVLEEYIVEGRMPDYSGGLNEEALISRRLASRLGLQLGDSFFAFFLRDDDPSKTPNQRKFELVGIYDSGFEEIDALYVFTDIRHIQRMNKWTENQVGNFEVFVSDFNSIEDKNREIYGQTKSNLDTQTIRSKYIYIFEWIDLFDFNIAIIIGIMIIVGGINMITALLVLILERTPMIGILKALGSASWSIRKVFLYNAAYLIGKGMIIGNLIGLGIVGIQYRFRVFKFPNPEEYYMEYIPVHLEIWHVLALNVGVFLLCSFMLLIPSYIINRISPVKAIRFE